MTNATPTGSSVRGSNETDGRTLASLVSAQMTRTPAAIAAIDGAEEISYSQLDDRADSIAAGLQAAGVRREDLVAVLLPRNTDLIASVLSTHRLGAAYLPLDSQYPVDRLRFMLSDARPAAIVCDSSTVGLARELLSPDQHPPTIVTIDDLPDAAPQAPEPARPRDLAYVIYTSGSTGRPKGAMLEHRNTVAMLDWVGAEFAAEDLSGVLFGTSICFDLSIFEIFATLTLGGTIIVAPNALALPELAARERVTVLNTVPAVTAALLSGGDFPSTVHTVIHSGDTTTRALADAIYSVPTVRKFYNLYGPTEVVTWQSGLLVERGDTAEPPIGLPFPRVGAHIVNRQDQPVPDGDVGELLLSGDQVGRGYLNRPELTAEKFVERPGLASGRLYRTGDLVRRDSDGVMHFCGRTDFQVKIRGFRVELGELEAVLERHAAVSDSVAVAQQDGARHSGNGNRRLVAFAQLADVADLDIEADDDGILHGPLADSIAGQLRAALSDALPEYMQPDALALMPALPLTENGKPDRSRLPKLKAQRPSAEPAGSAPMTSGRATVGATEELVAGIWREVLGDAEVPIPADVPFTALGGDSLQAAGVTSRLRHRLGASITLPQFRAAPTVQALAERLDADPERGLGDESGAIPHTGTVAPPTPAQREHWLGDQVVGGSQAADGAAVTGEPVGMWTIPLALQLRGPLDTDVLQRTLDCLVARHTTLRRAMPEVDRAELVEPYPVPLEVIDLVGLPVETQQATAEQAQHAEACSGLSLLTGRVLRAQVVRFAEDRAELLIHVHHASFDGLSNRVLITELADLYAALDAGAEPPPEPGVSVDDAARWLSHQEPTTEYWAKRLAGTAAEQGAPGGRALTGGIWAGGRVERAVDPTLAQRIHRFAGEHACGPFAVVLAATAIRVFRETGRTDVVVPTPMSSRRHPDLENVMGLLHQMVAVRCDLAGAPTFGELVTRLGRQSTTDLDHPAPPWAELMRMLGAGPRVSLRPTELVVAMQRGERPVTRDRLTWTYLGERDNGGAKSDFSLVWEADMAHPQVSAEFAAQRYTPADALALVDQILAIVEAGISHPDTGIDVLDWLTPSESAQIHSWCGAAGVRADERPVLERILEQAAATPDAVAVEDHRLGSVSYAQLLAGARRVAGQLPHGVQLVGLAACRGPKPLAAALGAWLRAAAYLPLDVAHPPQRLADVLADAMVDVVLADSHCPPLPGERLELDELLGDEPADWDVEPVQRPTAPATPLAPADPAYRLYTSGSSGRPKGVTISHGALSSFLTAMGELVPLSAADVVAYVTAPSFDISGLEMWLPLVSGARVRVVDEDTARDGFALAERLRGVTVTQMTPTGFQVMLAADWAGDEQMRVLVGGETFPPALAGRLLRSCAEVWNLYGPTEATIWASAHRVSHLDASSATIPLGRALPNSVVHIVDAGGALVPPGVVGEICLGGYSLAIGYHDRAELTRQQFLTLPELPDGGAGGRFYRTGDLGRWNSTGQLAYLGRADGQLKIRGVRVEIGEIEAALSRLPGVQAAAVGVAGAGAASARLVGYLVAPPEVSDDSVRDQLGETLPAAMVPDAWVRLTQLPLTANGKIDRKTLPAPEAIDAVRVPPATVMEELVAHVWSEVLGVEDIGRDDDFLARGGHSLLATEVAAQLRHDLELSVPVSAVFSHSRLRDFAGHLDELLTAEASK